MRFFSAAALVVLGVFWPLQQALADQIAGVQFLSIPSPARSKPLDVTIWYPASDGSHPILVGDDILFKGTEAFMNAPVQSGRHPLIVLSHGSGGSVIGLAWIATALAKAGYVVAGPDHPGTTRGNSTPIETTMLWQRTNDLSVLLDNLTTTSKWSDSINVGEIGVLGFSLGGHTALSIGGGQVRRNDYADYCDQFKTMPDCVWFASGHVNLRSIDKELFEQSNRDDRIQSVVAIDPSVIRAFTATSLKNIQIPVDVINLGTTDTIPVAVEASAVVGQIPHGSRETVPDAVHFTFLPECQPDGHEILKKFGETDLLCDDGGGRSRSAIHAQLIDMITKAFDRTLKAQ
ncbi:alpha/beta hydrolase family protein [Phyllobacterium myrsinacearum]|uniref:Dienelactone hydrolase n=1 Tax=Phyllobacterium myrsinacearum TaxID=28101 RepID=A0A2S9JDR6_9HYPH|nr:dienelactone hydrolase family protein [Phyllobacterium myrsinacearum]PRD51033.1 dienelactone hydrolase [Phyllobacterium myrsinacearum]PWV88261.1 putative dienelactone hydrolase [Phyllobacterium myrsinacearum]RZU97552.1 putative dienelactone hydrolase [Phyllobacterium myrsinacearum]